MAVKSALPTDKPSRIAFAGDWHGDLVHGEAVIRWASERGADGVLHLGDFGVWAGRRGKDYLSGLNRELNAQGMWLAFVDGNHEDFNYLEGFPLRRGVRPLTQRITHLPRGFRWTWGERTWLALGGATSLDVAARRPLIDWWPQEALTRQQVEKTIAGGRADYMLTHDAPTRAPVPGLREDIWREDAVRAANQHRELMDAVVAEVHPSHLFHGHMHTRYSATVPYEDGGELWVEGLGGNYEPFHDNVLLVDLDRRGELMVGGPQTVLRRSPA